MPDRSEKEKMLGGDLYLPTDPELVLGRLNARRLTRIYNETAAGNTVERQRLLSELFGQMGDRIEIEPPFRCDYGGNITLGNGVYLNFDCVFLDCAPISLGNNVACGPGVHIYAATHPLAADVRILGRESAKPVTIGHNVWIGGRAIICPGVTIGDDTTIGAGSVVTRDVPANVFAAGNPCRVIRTLA